jgi:hypothetical protein
MALALKDRHFENELARLKAALDKNWMETNTFEHPQQDYHSGIDLRMRIQAAGTTSHTVLFITCGLHGIEGLAGMRMISGLIERGTLRDLQGMRFGMVVVPCINTWGAANLRRVEEGNVDLNRNFLERWDGEIPTNPDYEGLHRWLVPKDWAPGTLRECDTQIAAFIERQGLSAFQRAVQGGQYTTPSGLFYGGTEQTWYNMVLHTIVQRHLSFANRIIHIDIHTGLGPYGVGEVICPAMQDDPMLARAQQWFGNVKSPFTGTSVSPPVSGHMAQILRQMLPRAEVTTIALEFGTYPIERVLGALRSEAVWHNNGRPEGDWAAAVHQEMLDCFFPNEAEWLESCLRQLDDRIEQAYQTVRVR